MHVLAEFGTGQVFWSFLWFVMFFIWIWLLIIVFSDIFRSHDLGGFAKAIWILFVIIVPYLGVLVYLIARGHKMQEHAMEAAKAQDQAMRAVRPERRGHQRFDGRPVGQAGRPQGAGSHLRRRVRAAEGQGAEQLILCW